MRCCMAGVTWLWTPRMPGRRWPSRLAWAISGMSSSISQVLWVCRRSWKCMSAITGGMPRCGSPAAAGGQVRRVELGVGGGAPRGAGEVDVAAWSAELDRLHARVSGRFRRAEPRRRVRSYIAGLVAGLDRRNGWTLAEHAGEASPDGMQRLLRWADWDVDGVRDDVRGYVIEHLGEPGGVLIVDDTGFLKKGTMSAGVQRQYSGTAGRIENCQIGTFLAYAGAGGHALIDRALYLPEPWIADRERCGRAGIPDGTEFATKPRQAMAMLARAFAAGVPFAWITADEAYGQVKYLRSWLEDHDAAYVLATKVNDLLITTDAA